MTVPIEVMFPGVAITATACPAISVPAGFTAGGLPVGLQLVDAYREDFSLLQFARRFEQAINLGARRPVGALQAERGSVRRR